MDFPIRWTGLKAVAQNSTVLTVVFGSVVVLGLPESLLVEDPSCKFARHAAISMGTIFVYAVIATVTLCLAYAFLVPSQLRDYRNLSEYVSINSSRPNPVKEEILTETWVSANSEQPMHRIAVTLLAVVSLLFFGTFSYTVLNFLEASKACTAPAPQQPPVHVNISELRPEPCRHRH